MFTFHNVPRRSTAGEIGPLLKKIFPVWHEDCESKIFSLRAHFYLAFVSRNVYFYPRNFFSHYQLSHRSPSYRRENPGRLHSKGSTVTIGTQTILSERL